MIRISFSVLLVCMFSLGGCGQRSLVVGSSSHHLTAGVLDFEEAQGADDDDFVVANGQFAGLNWTQNGDTATTSRWQIDTDNTPFASHDGCGGACTKWIQGFAEPIAGSGGPNRAKFGWDGTNPLTFKSAWFRTRFTTDHPNSPDMNSDGVDDRWLTSMTIVFRDTSNNESTATVDMRAAGGWKMITDADATGSADLTNLKAVFFYGDSGTTVPGVRNDRFAMDDLEVTGNQWCGDGIKNGSEQCDGSDLGGQTCTSSGFDGGTLACNLSCSLDTSGCYMNPAGLVGHWKFDTGTGSTAYDSSTNNHDGSIIGAYWTTGVVGPGALGFDGIDDKVVVGPATGFNGGQTYSAFTTVAWVNPASKTEAYVYRSASPDGVFSMSCSRIVVRCPGPVHYIADFNNPWNAWYQIAGTWDGATQELSLYVNGQLKKTVTSCSAITTAPYPSGNSIGGNPNNNKPECQYHGLIDDVRLFNRALTAVEIENLYNWTKPSP